MYFTDRGIEELVERRGEESVTLEWRRRAAARPSSTRTRSSRRPIERFATWLARDDEDDEE